MKTTLKRGTGHAGANGAGNGTLNGHASIPPAPLSQVTRYGPRPRSPLRAVGRFFFWLFLFLFVLVGGAAGGWVLWVNEQVTGTQAHSAEAREAQAILDEVPPADEPAVALVIGYDKRVGKDKGNESRSDTLILVRADPREKTISMLSLPRDLVVTIPACRGLPERQARINSAFTDCGMRGAVETVRELTGVPINYMVAVDFIGFKDIVASLGGVYVDVDRRYFNDNEGGGERYAKIDLHAGYQRLYGRFALGFVRYRHTDSDLYRNARQQEFMKAVKQQVSTFWSLGKLPGIVSAVTRNVEVGVGGGGALDFRTMLAYARLLYELPSGNVHQSRLAALSENSAFELFASEDVVDEAVDRLMNPDAEAGEKAATVAAGGKAVERDVVSPSSVTIEVQNGNGVAGAADDAAYLLSRRGYGASSAGNADRFDHFETMIVYDAASPDGEAAATQVANLFGDADVVSSDELAETETPLETTLRVVVGQTFKGHLAPAPRDETPKYQPPKVVRDATEVTPLLRRAQRRLDFPVLIPTVREGSSSLTDVEPVRAYRVNGHDALRITFNGPTGTDYWGIQQTTWIDAPLLEGPTTTRTIGDREYRLYFSGSRLHVVAFEENGAVYWVTNTLLDALTNETMLAIAKGLKPTAR